jgi:hypothetical protein
VVVALELTVVVVMLMMLTVVVLLSVLVVPVCGVAGARPGEASHGVVAGASADEAGTAITFLQCALAM